MAGMGFGRCCAAWLWPRCPLAATTPTHRSPRFQRVWPRVTSTVAYSKLQYMVTTYAFDDSVAAPLAAKATKCGTVPRSCPHSQPRHGCADCFEPARADASNGRARCDEGSRCVRSSVRHQKGLTRDGARFR